MSELGISWQILGQKISQGCTVLLYRNFMHYFTVHAQVV